MNKREREFVNKYGEEALITVRAYERSLCIVIKKKADLLHLINRKAKTRLHIWQLNYWLSKDKNGE